MKMKFSTGIWVFGPAIERFAPQGYRPDEPIVKRIERAAKVKGLEGLEFHYPTEVNEDNVDEVKNALAKHGLKAVGVPPVLSQEPKWKKGALSALNEKTRKEAVERCKAAADMARKLGAEILIIWPGREGFDYPFTTNYIKLWDNFVKSIKEIAEYAPDLKIAIEYKIEDPQAYLIQGSAGRALLVRLELGLDNVGINVEYAHAKMAREHVPETIALIARYNALFHLHLNDIFTGVDSDLIAGSVHLLEYAELLYWLHEINYEGWMGLDLFPLDIDPAQAVQESIYNIKSLYATLEEIGWENIRKVVEENSPIKAQKIIRQLLKKSL